jgi:NAD(P)-dependent dehydrogenase (short-subunit alcohol dehydrogenase family)
VSDGKRAESTGNGAEGSFTGKLAVVTGGGSGMGRELVRQLAAQGCSVAACDWHADTVAASVAMARADAPPGVRATVHACDVSDAKMIDAAVRAKPVATYDYAELFREMRPAP